MRKRIALQWLLVGLIIVISAGCAAEESNQTTSTQESGDLSSDIGLAQGTIVEGSTNWNEDSHGNDSELNYAVVFPGDSVNRIDIILSDEAWTDLHTELTAQLGEQGSGEQAFNNPGQMPGGRDFNNSQQPPAMGEQNLQPPQGQQPPTESEQNWQPPENQPRDVNRGSFDISDTSYVSSTVLFNGETWDYVGFRYSGNSTLQTS